MTRSTRTQQQRPDQVPRLWLRHALLAGVALAAGGLALLSYGVGMLSSFEASSVDPRFSIRGVEAPGAGIVIVAVDQPTLNAFDKRYPIPRMYYRDCSTACTPSTRA